MIHSMDCLMMNVLAIVVYRRILSNSYNHFKDYVETNPSKMHPNDYGNNKFKINFDRNIHKLRIKYLKQELCTECFYYYPKKTMIYTDEPYLDAGLKSEYWWYCTPECVDFRLDLNKY